MTILFLLPLLLSANEVCEGYVFTCVCLSTGGRVMHGRGRRGLCMAGEMATAAGGTHPTGMHSCLLGWACMAGRCAWQGTCMAGGRRGPCMAGEMATAAGGTHPTGMHSCLPWLAHSHQALAVLLSDYFNLFALCIGCVTSNLVNRRGSLTLE